MRLAQRLVGTQQYADPLVWAQLADEEDERLARQPGYKCLTGVVQRLAARWGNHVVDALDERLPALVAIEQVAANDRFDEATHGMDGGHVSAEQEPPRADPRDGYQPDCRPVVAAGAVGALGGCRSVADLAALVEQRAHGAG